MGLFDFGNLFSNSKKASMTVGSVTSLFQAPQIQSFVQPIAKSLKPAFPSFGSTILAPAAVVSRGVYDALNMAGATYGQINQYNPMVVSAAKIQQPQQYVISPLNLSTPSVISGLSIAPIKFSSVYSPSYQSPLGIGGQSGAQMYPGLPDPRKLSAVYQPLLPNVPPVTQPQQPQISLGNYVFGSGLKFSLPWSKPKSRTQKYSKHKTAHKTTTKKRSRRKCKSGSTSRRHR